LFIRQAYVAVMLGVIVTNAVAVDEAVAVIDAVAVINAVTVAVNINGITAVHEGCHFV